MAAFALKTEGSICIEVKISNTSLKVSSGFDEIKHPRIYFLEQIANLL